MFSKSHVSRMGDQGCDACEHLIWGLWMTVLWKMFQWNAFERVLLQMVALPSRNVHSHLNHHVHSHLTLGNGQKQGKTTRKNTFPEQCRKNFCKQNVLFRFVFEKTVHSKFQTLAFQHSWPFCEKCHWCPFLETWPFGPSLSEIVCDLESNFSQTQLKWKVKRLDVLMQKSERWPCKRHQNLRLQGKKIHRHVQHAHKLRASNFKWGGWIPASGRLHVQGTLSKGCACSDPHMWGFPLFCTVAKAKFWKKKKEEKKREGIKTFSPVWSPLWKLGSEIPMLSEFTKHGLSPGSWTLPPLHKCIHIPDENTHCCKSSCVASVPVTLNIEISQAVHFLSMLCASERPTVGKKQN